MLIKMRGWYYQAGRSTIEREQKEVELLRFCHICPTPKGRIGDEADNVKYLRRNSEYKLSVGVIREDLY
jgi:hypothetical protein